VDELSILWPSGIEQVLEDVPADRILTVAEPPGTGAPAPQGGPLPEVRLSARPNPFRAATTVVFSLGRPGPATLSVHDAAGRRMRRWTAGDAPAAGENRIVWNGRDEAGRRVAAGVYFLRLEAGSAAAVRKIVLID
jgi:hypothetical protein